jgi:spermidine/putrescine transport system ATP-binding protein
MAMASRDRVASEEPPVERRSGDRDPTGGAAAAGQTASLAAQPSTRNAVEVKGVTIRYKGVTALDSVDIAIRQGEFFSLLGPSGCGKTTTLSTIGGFVQPDAGDVLIEGRSVLGTPPYRRPVNTVFQSYALFPHMSVAENIGFGPRMAGMPREETARRVEDALRLVSLSGMGERRPSQLSGGQQQRVALARALVNRPAVLLLDEPLGALDLKLRKQMQLELSRIQREVGITFVYVTHDQEEAMTMSDRIAVMSRGSVVQIGTPQEIYEHPATLFVADFIGLSNILTGEVLDQAGSVRLSTGAVVRVPPSTAAPAGSKAAVVVRPDHMSLSRTPPGGETNAIRGRVTKLSFLGTHLQISVAISAREDIVVSRPLAPEEQSGPLPVRGEEVLVTWSVARSYCFPETGAARSAPQSPIQ